MDLTTATPPTIDTELARLHGDVAAAAATVDAAIESLHRYAGHRAYYEARGRRTFAESGADAVAWGRANLDTIPSYDRRNLERTLASLDAARAAAATAKDAMVPLDGEYARRPWSRFFLVPGGHIHASAACHTFRWTTQVGWLPDLSGLTEADAVAAHGTILCTHCFPSAPVEWTTGLTVPADPSTCPGSGKDATAATDVRSGYYSGNGGTCPDCETWQTITSNGYGKIRKHKTPTAK